MGFHVRIGVLKETKAQEGRVALTPAGALALARAGHQVMVETGAGDGSGFQDGDYAAAGAELEADRRRLAAACDMVLKVKEPQPDEYDLFRPGQVLFTYLHLAANAELTQALCRSGAIAIAYETVQREDGSLPLLTPMSEIAGRMATQIGAHFLEKAWGGKGILLSGVPGVRPGDVVILGGGTVGTNAAKIAVGMGAQVSILDINLERLRYLDDIFAGRLRTVASNPHAIAEHVARADLLIGAVLVPGARAPRLVSEEMVKTMAPGSVIIDVAVDQGGSIETIDRATTHDAPTYLRHGVVHYAVANIPGAVPRTSTIALTNATLGFALELANAGPREALRRDPALARGVNVCRGHVTHRAVAEAHGLPYRPLAEVL